jgi:hypothetical protein
MPIAYRDIRNGIILLMGLIRVRQGEIEETATG